MAGREIRFLPRFTTLSGGGTGAGQDYVSEAFEVVPYASLVVEFMLEAARGTGATVKAQLQTGSDLDSLEDTGTEETLVAGTPARQVYASPSRYVRLRVNLSTASGTMMATLWAMGIAREA